MSIAKKELRGLIQGRTVILNDDPGLIDGQPVIVVPATIPDSSEDARARLLRAAGSWASDEEEELDHYLEWNRMQRTITCPGIVE